MQNAHLPAVRFAPRAYMGCGGWDLAKAPTITGASLEQDYIPGRAAQRPRRKMGCGQGGFPSMPTELVEPDEKTLSCGGGGYAPSFTEDDGEGPIETLKPGISGRARRPQVTIGCGDEPCEECAKAAAAAGMGCTKCKRIRKHAANNQELDGSGKLGQAAGLPDTSILVVSGLAVAGLFYLATQ
jgi:hypothetical protein